jgi:hypothetical protein
MGNLLVGIYKGHFRKDPTLFKYTRKFKGDIADPSFNPPHIVSNMSIIYAAVAVGKIGGHRGHNDPIFQPHRTDFKGTKESFKRSHAHTSLQWLSDSGIASYLNMIFVQTGKLELRLI